MALATYMRLKGQKQGEIKGSCEQKGRENSIIVIAVNHDLISPRDGESGLPTGKRTHKPLVITKELDKATPLLYNSLVHNENLTDVELKFYKPQIRATGGMGQEVNHFNIKLTNATIASITMRMPNNKHPELKQFETYEEVSFTYERIEWTWVEGGVTGYDSWITSGESGIA
jgi:type VI secretion system secreted protein Hcp